MVPMGVGALCLAPRRLLAGGAIPKPVSGQFLGGNSNRPLAPASATSWKRARSRAAPNYC